MPGNFIDATGLTIQTRAQIVAELLNGADTVPGFLAIYGADINVDPNSPDGQLINLFAQGKIDVLELIQQVFDGFDPEQAIGRVLDMRCGINGVVRQAGTYTLQNVLVTVTQALTLAGLDTAPDAPFTVADAAGNRFLLVATHVFGGAGSASLAFQAERLGAVATTPNTITRVVTIQLGVASVNNPTTVTSVGLPEETDAALRIRRSRSVSLPSKGYLEGLVGALAAIDGVTSERVLENNTNGTVGGIPGHSIWCIVQGGTNADVAEAIYVKRNAGCGMKGAVTVSITQVDGSTFDVLFDRPTAETLWITFNATAITGIADETYIRTQLLARLFYDIGQPADASAIVALVKEIAPNVYVDTEGVSNTNGSYVALKNNATVDKQWALLSARIIINGNPGP